MLIFVAVEDDMQMIDAFYHSIMTATTIGLGDMAPQSQAGRAYGIVHMLLCTIIFGSMLGTLLGVRHRPWPRRAANGRLPRANE